MGKLMADQLKRYEFGPPRQSQRQSMVAALETIGADWPGIRQPYDNSGAAYRRRTTLDGIRIKRGFWPRNEHRLDLLANEVQRAFRRTIKQVQHDFDDNKAQAQAVIGAYGFCKRQLAARGVEV